MNRLTRVDHTAVLALLTRLETAVDDLATLACSMDFDERERERLERLRPHLAFLYRTASRRPDMPEPVPGTLTPREHEVMRWLSFGKTDAEIAALLAMSPRTVHKHLEHIYVKLGVETRTAAVMRMLALRPQKTKAGAGPAFVGPRIV